MYVCMYVCTYLNYTFRHTVFIYIHTQYVSVYIYNTYIYIHTYIRRPLPTAGGGRQRRGDKMEQEDRKHRKE